MYKNMKDNPELITAGASLLGSIVKAIKIRLNWRQTISSVVLATVIGYLMPTLIGEVMEDASQQMTIAVSLLVGFTMHTLTDIVEEQIKNRFSFFDKKEGKK